MRSKREERQQRRQAAERRGQMKWLIYISIAAVAVVGILILSNWAESQVPIATTEPITYKRQNGSSIGDPNAPVKLVEVADFQCPYCHRFYSEVEQQIIQNYVDTGKVYFTIQVVAFLDGGSGESERAAEAAYCAGDQEMFWEYHGLVYTNQNGENQGAFRDSRLVAFANSLGLDTDAFNACFNGGTKAADVQSAGDYAANHGISSVPSFVINEQDPPLIGLQSYEQLSAALDAALAGSQ